MRKKFLLTILLPILLILFSLAAFSEVVVTKPFLLTPDSLITYPTYIEQNWRFKEGDDSSWALPAFNDSSWREVSSLFMLNDSATKSFNGIGWFRLHMIVDSTVSGKMLAMTITQFGASEIYLDGKLIKSFGKINGADSSQYYDPQSLPFIFMAPEAGEHLLAVRYANYNAEKNYKRFHQPMAGFKMSIGDVD